MDSIRKYLSVLCAGLFMISTVFALFALNVEWRAFNAENYKRAFDELNLYQRMPDILADTILASVAQDQNSDPYLRAVGRDQWRGVIVSVLPPELVKSITDNALDSTFDYINGRTDSVVVSLVPVKQNLINGGGIQIMTLVLNAQPDCTAEQLFQMGLGFLTAGEITLCNVPPEMLGLITPLLESQVQVMISAFPDEISILPESSQSALIKLNRLRTFFKLTPILPLIFLFCLTILAVRNLFDWLTWWGWPLFVAGFFAAISAWIGAPIFGAIVQRLLQSQGAGFIPVILFSTLGETMTVVASQILKPIIIEGIIIGLAGLGMGLLAILISGNKSFRVT